MRQYGNDQILYSLSDLLTFLGCHHARFLDVRVLSEDIDKVKTITTGRRLQKKRLACRYATL
ncbi:MAG: hypothetical protein PSN37_03365 [Alphaproteobacteria bacterium]|nr:hypothetical protein [Alphaproteobacteria bacterium]